MDLITRLVAGLAALAIFARLELATLCSHIRPVLAAADRSAGATSFLARLTLVASDGTNFRQPGVRAGGVYTGFRPPATNH